MKKIIVLITLSVCLGTMYSADRPTFPTRPSKTPAYLPKPGETLPPPVMPKRQKTPTHLLLEPGPVKLPPPAKKKDLKTFYLTIFILNVLCLSPSVNFNIYIPLDLIDLSAPMSNTNACSPFFNCRSASTLTSFPFRL